MSAAGPGAVACLARAADRLNAHGRKTGDRRLRAGLPKTWVTVDKTGASGHGDDGDIAGVWPSPARPLVICAYLMGAKAPAEAQDAAFASLAGLAAARLAPRA